MTAAVQMPSVFTVPDIAKTTSFRLPASLRLKLERVRDLWRVVAENQNQHKKKEEIEAIVDAIDITFVLVTLSGRQADEELQQFGGIALTPEQWEAQLKALRTAAKKSSK